VAQRQVRLRPPPPPICAPSLLPADWPERTEVTRARGDGWLTSGSSALLSVPSAIVPETFNVLLNPAHQGAKRVVIVETGEHAIDPRLPK
jgi:RES domain-containing protein